MLKEKRVKFDKKVFPFEELMNQKNFSKVLEVREKNFFKLKNILELVEKIEIELKENEYYKKIIEDNERKFEVSEKNNSIYGKRYILELSDLWEKELNYKVK